MSNMVKFAERELDIIGMKDDGDMNGMMRKHILHMVDQFANEGHSGFSASYALQCLKKLLAYKPLSPLTGEDGEWGEVSEHMGRKCYQNKRYSAVFKDEDGAYNIEGRVFWEWLERDRDPDEEGYPGTHKFKSYYTNRDSRVYITFPYEVPETPEYVERASERTS